jgi:hypothetical protein
MGGKYVHRRQISILKNVHWENRERPYEEILKLNVLP